MQLLPYEKQVLLDTLSDDCLTIFAEGLPFENILCKLLESYCDPCSLVLAIEFPSYLQTWLLEKLTLSEVVTTVPKKLTSEFNMDNRTENYMEGGIKFVTKRILLIDLLQKRIPIDLITGLVFYNVNTLSDTSVEAFITRLYRQDNKTGFIKAFSSSPIQMAQMNQLEITLNHLFLPKFYLWPRFHVNVSESIDKHKCEVIEVHIPLTESMKSLQLCIIEILHFCLKEIKKFVPSLESELLQVENAVAKNFYRSLKQKLDPIWATLGENAKQTISDIKTISNLNNNLVRDDAVRFYRTVHKMRPTFSSKIRISLWLFTEAFEKLLKVSKSRVENREKCVELSPKWQSIKEILEEIMGDLNTKSEQPILICVSSFIIARQIVQFVKEGEAAVLKKDLNIALSKVSEDDFDEDDVDKIGLELSHNIHFLILTRHFVINEVLTEINPNYVIMYEPDLFLIRTFEVFRCRRPGVPLRIYFLLYDNSVEEQRYLTHLTKEKKCFENMIHMKGKLVVHTDQDGKRGFNPLLERGEKGLKFADIVDDDSRSGGLTEPTKNFPKVVVDMREFRSSLPSILHKSGLDIVPKTIEIGDYLLTPDICVERKSIEDLIGSLNSGRLYQQCQAMCRHYKHPMLLIEFEESRGFNLLNYSEVGDHVTTRSLQTQLVLISLHFPNLRMFWSESVYTTASMFIQLKKGKDDPCSSLTLKKDKASTSTDFNSHIVDLVLALPGITSKNYYRLVRHFENIYALANASQQELKSALENEVDAKKLFDFFRSTSEEEKQDTSTALRTKFSKFTKFKR